MKAFQLTSLQHFACRHFRPSRNPIQPRVTAMTARTSLWTLDLFNDFQISADLHILKFKINKKKQVAL
jgi:hypothetical protein